MSLLRGLLFDNLGLKLVAVLLAVLVYLNVYTDRPATMIVTFPIQVTDLHDTLSLSGPAPAAVQAELRGTAKQLIRLRVAEPPVKVSMAGVGAGRYERALGIEDLPIPVGVELQLDRMVSPRTLELQVDRKDSRQVPVSVAIQDSPAALWDGTLRLRPTTVTVVGPAAALAALDTVHLQPVSLAGRRDTVVTTVEPLDLPDWCTMEPERVEVWVPLEAAVVRRFTVQLEPPQQGTTLVSVPNHVTAIVTTSRRMASAALSNPRATWRSSGSIPAGASHRSAVRSVGEVPKWVQIRFDPDSVTVRRPR